MMKSFSMLYEAIHPRRDLDSLLPQPPIADDMCVPTLFDYYHGTRGTDVPRPPCTSPIKVISLNVLPLLPLWHWNIQGLVQQKLPP